MRLGDATGSFLALAPLLPCLCTYDPVLLKEGLGDGGLHTTKGSSSESSVRGKGRATAGLLQQVLPQGLLPLSWGCGQEPRHAG